MSTDDINITNTSTPNMACTEPPVNPVDDKESMSNYKCYMCSDSLPDGEYGPKARCDNCIENTPEEICCMCDSPSIDGCCNVCHVIIDKEFVELRMLGEDMETWMKRIGKCYDECEDEDYTTNECRGDECRFSPKNDCETAVEKTNTCCQCSVPTTCGTNYIDKSLVCDLHK